jgi:branched-subunit amino acid aminotransferase/4-amino-4-deoxychorismate lyase
VLAKAEVKKAGYDEAIMLDAEGYKWKPAARIFFVRGGKIKTTPLTWILPGITRDSIMIISASGAMKSSKSVLRAMNSTSPGSLYRHRG